MRIEDSSGIREIWAMRHAEWNIQWRLAFSDMKHLGQSIQVGPILVLRLVSSINTRSLSLSFNRVSLHSLQFCCA
jgi:hypothetical protein